ncbi:restriction endonuclease PLD domain-containing protein [Priestia aryabhattai]|uniref:restriction endonuclease PLD domain-containing protein n=1 Tax=Priestia TaxID=2800373 RepID=UPI003F88905D
MRILSNIDSNHYNSIKNILLNANELHIISPFLMENFGDFFYEIIETDIKRVILTTTLKDNDPDLLKKVNSLHSLCYNCLKYKIDYEIHIDNKLHGKIYVSSMNGVPIKGIITSANFTEAGLGFNHEWGVEIDDTNQLKKILNDISSVSSHALSTEELKKIIVRIDNYLNNDTSTPRPKIDLKVNDLIKYTADFPINNSDQKYFIKPVGWAERPFSLERTLSDDVETLHFSKRRPTAVRVGDIVICYAVGTTKLLGYFEVLSEPVNSMVEGDRWPWSIEAKNLCPDYSENWNSFRNTISSIQNSYNNDIPMTYAGGKTLGALNFGSDRIQLTKEFAQHVIKIIKESI